jgi:hypothetical protein
MDRDLELVGTVEHRRSLRRRVVLAARVDAPSRSRAAVTQEISRTGAFVLTSGFFPEGESVEVAVLPARTTAEVHIRGRVVRTIPRAINSPWQYALAISFAEPLSTETALLMTAP